MKPRISLLDKRFKYRHSTNTDVGETFRRARRRAALVESIEKRKKDAQAPAPKACAEVVSINKKAGGQ